MATNTNSQLLIGHLLKDQESKIKSTAVNEGQIIYSEKTGMQHVDYNGKRHTYGSIISGLQTESSYIDFETSTLTAALNAIKSNGFINDGQIVKIAGDLYQYRNILTKHFLVKHESTSIKTTVNKTAYIIYLPNYASGNQVNIDLVISINNATHGDKLFFVKIVNNTLNLSVCEDLDGAFDSTTFDLTVTATNGLFEFQTKVASELKIVSYSVSSNEDSSNEGIYIAESV